MLMSEDASVSIAFLQNASLDCCSSLLDIYPKATAIVIFTKSFLLLFAHEKLTFDLEFNKLGVKIAA